MADNTQTAVERVRQEIAYLRNQIDYRGAANVPGLVELADAQEAVLAQNEALRKAVDGLGAGLSQAVIDDAVQEEREAERERCAKACRELADRLMAQGWRERARGVQAALVAMRGDSQ